MHSRLLKLAVVLVLLLCVGCYIAELCDTWDSASSNSPDTEFSIVRLMLCVGTVLVFARFAHRHFTRILRSRSQWDSLVHTCNGDAPFFPEYSVVPDNLRLLALRI